MPLNDLNLGSKNALQSAVPSPDHDALTEPPPGYTPGYTAPVHNDFQNNPVYRIGEVLSAIATPPGEISAPMKLRMAQQDADLKKSQNKLAWDNFYQQSKLVKETMKQHNLAAIQQGIGMLPQFKALVMAQDDPEKRTAMASHLAGILDNFGPGLGKVMELADKEPAHILGYDMLMEHPIYGPQFQSLAGTMSYETQAGDPQIKMLVENMGRDTIPLIISRFTMEEHATLASGKMTQDQFIKAYDRAVMDESFGPVKPKNIAFAKAVLNTPYGEEIMEGKGVKTYAMVKRLNSKEKPEGQADLAKELKNKSILKAQADLEDAEANPGKYSREYVATLKEDLRIHAGLVAKQSNQSVNPNNSVVQRFDTNTKGKYGRYEDLAKLPEGPEKEEAYAAAATARKQADQASASSAMGVKLGAPGDTSNYIDRDVLLKTGRAIGIKGEVSQGDLLRGGRYMKATPDQKKQISDFNISEQSALQIFDSADKALKGSPYAESQADAVLRKEDSVWNAELKAVAKANFPELAEYISRREATLGKFARSISGEVGVLTDQDVQRVRNLFPVGGDTKEIRTSKKKALIALISLNRKFTIEMLAGEMAPEDAFALKSSKKYTDAINGIFGSVEGLARPQEVNPGATTPSKDKPKASVNSLMQDLEAGR